MREHMTTVHGIPIKSTPLQVVDGMTPEQTLRVTIHCDTCTNWLIMQATMNDALIAYGKHCQAVHP